MSDKDEAQRLADALEHEYTQGRISNQSGREAAALLRRWPDDAERIAALEAENLRLAGEVANRNRRALEGDEARAGLERVHDHYERREAALEARIAALEEELETERLRLAAVGLVAIADTPESAASARQMHDDYRSAALDDVIRRVDECIKLRAALEQARGALERLIAVYATSHSSTTRQSAWEQARAALRAIEEVRRGSI